MLRIKNHSGNRGALAVRLLLALLLIVAAVYVCFFLLFGVTIPPGMIGLRQTKFGPLKGFAPRSLEPGVHWGIPGGFYSVVHLFPGTIQPLHFHRAEPGDEKRGEGQLIGASLPALEVQTADRATVDVDITVLSRLYREPGKESGDFGTFDHGGPADLAQKVGVTADSWRNHIGQITGDEIKRALGSISTGQFYDPRLRERQIEIAHGSIARALAPYGIKIEAVLLRRYSYRDDRIDQAIFQKNLQDQEERLNVQASAFAEQQAKLEQVAAEKDAEIKTLRVSGEGKASVKESEGRLYETRKQADGDLEVARAKADVDKARAEALSSSEGAGNYVARELAGVVSSMQGGIVSDIDPYDLDAWMKRLGLGGAQREK